jgi:hypothetical protein
MKISPVGAELLQADRHRDRQTDMTQLIVAFHNFAAAPKNRYMVTKLDENIQSSANYFVTQEMYVSSGSVCTRLHISVTVTT